jgi:hypothetical protein
LAFAGAVVDREGGGAEERRAELGILDVVGVSTEHERFPSRRGTRHRGSNADG